MLGQYSEKHLTRIDTLRDESANDHTCQRLLNAANGMYHLPPELWPFDARSSLRTLRMQTSRMSYRKAARCGALHLRT